MAKVLRIDEVRLYMMQAVIGGGAAGLVAARELIQEGHKVTVFEQGHRVGGVWVLDDRVENDPLGQSEERHKVHSSMYDSLRTNLPRELMGFADFPFVPEVMLVSSPRCCVGGSCLIRSVVPFQKVHWCIATTLL